ncbi:MAG: DNA polymerase III subunit beta [Deltaproteobacteria bacterium]
MRFSADALTLSEKLALLQGISERKTTIPILTHVLLSASNNAVQLSATDLETTMIVSFQAAVSKNGSLAIPSRKLYEIVKELPQGEIEIEEIGNHWIQLKTPSATFKIAGLPGEDFPAIPEVSSEATFSIESSPIDDMIAKTIFAVSQDEIRRNIVGIYFEKIGKQSLRLVATDGHRLSLVDRNMKFDIDLGRSFILPKKGIAEIRKMVKLSDTLKIGCGKNFFTAEGDGIILIVRLIDAEFPDYKQVIPEVTKNTFGVKKTDFLSALRRVSVLSAEKTRSVKIFVNGSNMTLVSVNPEVGDAKETVPLDFGGEPLELGFNASYLMDVLQAMGGESIQIGITDELSPAVIKPVGEEVYISVIMPMRV